MSDLIAIVCIDEAGAGQLRARLRRPGDKRPDGLLDAAVFVRRRDGRVSIEQVVGLVGPGALGSAFWGMLAGLIFFMPSLGLAVAAVTGALDGKFDDIGVDDDFVQEAGQQILPGQSALLLLLSGNALDRLEPRLRSSRARIVRTNLAPDQEARLRAAFGA